MKINSEWDLVSKLRKLTLETGNSLPENLVKGIGDDCAVYKIDENRYGLFTADISIENTHFRLDYSLPADIGYKSMMSNISDIISMGGSPLLAFVSAGIPADRDEEFVMDIYRGMLEACRPAGIVIAGGDTSRSEKLVVSIALYGECIGNKPVYRSGAGTGDSIYVTGKLGDSKAGLDILNEGNDETVKKYRPLVEKHLRPSCRYDIVQDLLNTYSPSAMIDISDGLLSDLGHLCMESGRGFIIYREKLPLSKELQEYCMEKNTDAYETALTGGEEYQLLFTSPLPPEKIPGRVTGDAVYIGEISESGYTLSSSGKIKEISINGFDHFKQE